MQAVKNDNHCHHCGDQCSSNSPQKGALRFCCQGCLSVYEILSQHDACDYYAVSPGSGVRPTAILESTYSAIDVSPERSHVVEYEDDHVIRARFVLPSMHCASCVWLLERLHRFDSGIISSRVDLLRHTVLIECDRSLTSLAQVARLLASLGYEPEIDRSHESSRSKHSTALRTLYMRLGVAGFAAGNVMMIGLANYIAGTNGFDPIVKLIFDILSIGLSIPVLLYSAQPWLSSAIASLRRGIVNLDVPVALGITTIFLRSCVEIANGSSEGFLDSFTGLVFFLLIGKLFQQKAFASIDFNRSARSFFPISATKLVEGHEVNLHIDNILAGDVIIVRNGEVIPADAILLYEPGVVDYSYITGESIPVECAPGKMMFAGGRVMGRALILSVVKPSSASYMASLWSRNDVHTERSSYSSTSDRFGLVFTLATVSIALLGGLYWLPDVSMSISVMTSVLIIACPCALTLSAPIAYGYAMSLLSDIGVYIRSSSIIAELQNIGAVVFDKTGTLTEPRNVRYHGTPLTSDQAAGVHALASQSTHPISRAIARTMPDSEGNVYDVAEVAGKGIMGTYRGDVIRLAASSVHASLSTSTGQTDVIVNDEHLGSFSLEHAVRPGVHTMIDDLSKNLAVHLLTGDSSPLSPELSDVFASCDVIQGASPAQKVDHVVRLQSIDKRVLMVGDGLNDLAALSAANVSVAVSNSTAKIVPACDIVLDAEHLGNIPSMLAYAKKQKAVVATAFWFTMMYNVIGLSLSLTGQLTPVITAIMMPASSLFVVAISIAGSWMTFRSLRWV